MFRDLTSAHFPNRGDNWGISIENVVLKLHEITRSLRTGRDAQLIVSIRINDERERNSLLIWFGLKGIGVGTKHLHEIFPSTGVMVGLRDDIPALQPECLEITGLMSYRELQLILEFLHKRKPFNTYQDLSISIQGDATNKE